VYGRCKCKVHDGVDSCAVNAIVNCVFVFVIADGRLAWVLPCSTCLALTRLFDGSIMLCLRHSDH
jgi:hypothetical protein